MRTDTQGLNRNRAASDTTSVASTSLLRSLASRLRVISFAIPGVVLLALGLIPVFSSDRLPRSAFSFSCLLAGAVFLFADYKIFPQISGMKVLTPQFWNPKERDWYSYTLLGSVWFLVVTLVMISVSVLSSFYSARLQHSELLRHGTIAQAKVLKKCGNSIHGCLAIDYRSASRSIASETTSPVSEKRYQKSISIDQKFYQKLEDGDAITIVYPKGQPTSARFTEFDFSVWKPSVPRAWGLILIVLLTLTWFPTKLLIFRARRAL